MTDSPLRPTTPAQAVAWLVALAIGGGISGLLSALALSASDMTGLLLPGLFFAVVLAAYLWNVGHQRSAGAVTAIFCWSASAYWIVCLSSVVIGDPAAFLVLLADDARDLHYAESRSVAIVASAIGTAIVSIGFLSLVQPRASALRIALEAAACTVLGAAIVWAGTSYPNPAFVGPEWKGVTVVVWQAGIACFLGLLCVARARRQPAGDRRPD